MPTPPRHLGALIFSLSTGSCSAVNTAIPPITSIVAFVLAAVIFGAAVASGASGSPAVSFKKDVAPLLQRRCVTCHGEESAKGGYRLDTFARLSKAGESDLAPIVPHLSTTALIQRIREA